jgi:pimeloyl-ACP methyl ester carboxylesterase
MRGHVASSSLDHLLGGPFNLAIGDSSEFLEDIHVSYEHLFLVRSMQGSNAPVHLYANCFGARIAFAYAQEWGTPSEGIASIITTSPGTNMKKGESASPAERVGVLSPIESYQDVQLEDTDFTSNPVALQEMADEDLSLILRQITNRFMLSARGLTKKMQQAFKTDTLQDVPALVIIPQQDKIIHTDATQATFADNYPGSTLVAWLDTEHMIEFDNQAQQDLVSIMSQWIYNQEQGWAGYRGAANFATHLKAQHRDSKLPKLVADKVTAYR